jgi:hypothetical protein
MIKTLLLIMLCVFMCGCATTQHPQAAAHGFISPRIYCLGDRVFLPTPLYIAEIDYNNDPASAGMFLSDYKLTLTETPTVYGQRPKEGFGAIYYLWFDGSLPNNAYRAEHRRQYYSKDEYRLVPNSVTLNYPILPYSCKIHTLSPNKWVLAEFGW